jgi:DNA-binding winged helix-turn-helix (wHTH) protein
MGEQTKAFYDFASFRVDPVKRRLLCEGQPVPLATKAFDTLLVLVENRGRVVDKDELMKRVWPDSFVEEANLTQNIFTLRKALGEGPTEHQYIVTVPRRGYRFVATVKECSDETAASESRAPSESSSPSMAVLPFKWFLSGSDEEYLGLGMADALITRLSNITQMIVRPTSAVLKFSALNQDPIVAGSELRVDAVLEGSIRASGDRIRVTVQLVSMQTGATLWAAKFDEKFTDMFEVEDSISEKVRKRWLSD